jgi:hypothetical protein
MLQLSNQTPFKAAFAKFPDASGVDTLYVIVTATFELIPKLQLADKQLEPVLSDEYNCEPSSSSVRCASELHLGKPGTDVILVGHARTPRGKPATNLHVGVKLGPVEKMLQVFGDRTWRGIEPSKAEPFVQMPLLYERAFGGSIRAEGKILETDDRNPVGVGLAIARAQAAFGDPLPNIEDPRQLLQEGSLPEPAGLGCIAPAWLPRRNFAGTYDERWQRTRAPYLPDDFDARYFHCASEGLRFDRCLKGGEPLVLLGVSERGPIHTAVPSCSLETKFALRGELHEAKTRLQTVLLEPDDNRLRLTYHAHFQCDKLALEVERIELRLQHLDLSVPSP